MSAKERARLEVFGRVKAGDITLVKASEILGMSYRQGSVRGRAIRRWVRWDWCTGCEVGPRIGKWTRR
ncbi:hypothetical protein THTE_4265 [Thermogutta terrifontis]|uniref:Uncharacterized protein n=2 Tax=Thermogutta terrifontis TaxID=1331910 RepID=A0A286RLN2_9BACT|nr:hypothetical protein THTE_4265 [Thermogutta terrifontis]